MSITTTTNIKQRSRYQGGTKRCKIVLYAFQQCIENQNYTFISSNNTIKKVKVTIRNDNREYITTSYIGIVMAPILVVVGSSSFSRFSALASNAYIGNV